MDENGANQCKLILELRVCFVVAMLAVHFSAIYEIVRIGFRSVCRVSHLESSQYGHLI